MAQNLNLQLIQSIGDIAKLSGFLEKLVWQTNADAGVFRVLDFSDFSYPITITAGKGIFTEDFFAEYDGGMVMSDPQLRVGLDRVMPEYSVYMCHEHYDEDYRKTDPYFTEFLPRHSISWFGGYLQQFDNIGVGFGLASAPDKEHFS